MMHRLFPAGKMRGCLKIPAVCAAAMLFFFIPVVVFSEVLVRDQIVIAGAEVQLQAETKGVYFAKGGQVVEFFRNDKSLGSVLSGGDGIAYKPQVFSAKGLFRISAKSKKDRGTGAVLSLGRGQGVVCIDIEGGLLAGPFSREPVQKSREAVRKIIRKYPVVYLHTGVLGVPSVKEWLRKNAFPESVVITWDLGSAFREMNRKGIKIRAVIGSQVFAESGREFATDIFSLDESAGAAQARDWAEIEKKLLGKR